MGAGAIIWKVLKSRWFWFAALIIALLLSIKSCHFASKEKERWKDNYDASTTFNSEKSQEITLTKKEFKDREDSLRKVIKENKIPLNRVQYIHQIKWKQGKTDTVTFVDTVWIDNGEMVPGEYAELIDSCVKVTYARNKGDHKGTLGYDYKGELNIIAYWERPKPKFWNWLAGKKRYVVEISSPCFGDTNVVFNKKVNIK